MLDGKVGTLGCGNHHGDRRLGAGSFDYRHPGARASGGPRNPRASRWVRGLPHTSSADIAVLRFRMRKVRADR